MYEKLKEYIKGSDDFYWNLTKERLRAVEHDIRHNLNKTTMLAVTSIVVLAALYVFFVGYLKKS